MKKLISILLALVFAISVSAQEQRILHVPYIYQVHIYGWCWVATCNSIIEYYGTNLDLCDVVEYARSEDPSRYGYVDCCNTPTPNMCIDGNYLTVEEGDGSISDVLDHWGITNDAFYDNLSFNDVQTEINSGRPIMVGWQLSSSAHAVILRGYDEPDSDVFFIDPLSGYHIETYAWFDDDGSHEWTGTAQLTATPTCSDADSEFTELINSDIRYFETNTIEISSTIYNADVAFIYGKKFIVNPGFEINVGSTLEITPDPALPCD